MNKSNFIKCPHCGAEYLPEEIFIGDEFLGNRNVTKLKDGTIDWVEGDEPELESSYYCDYCNTKIIVKAKVSYDVEQEDFDEEYSVKIK